MQLDLFELVAELELSFELGAVAELDVEPCIGVGVKVCRPPLTLPGVLG